MNSQTVQIRLFGAFRNYSKASEITIEIESASSINDVKAGLLEKLSPSNSGSNSSSSSSSSNDESLRTLLSQSAVANETRVLEASELILPGMKLAILPPVCGG